MARLLDRAIIVNLHDDTTQMILYEGYNLDPVPSYQAVRKTLKKQKTTGDFTAGAAVT